MSLVTTLVFIDKLDGQPKLKNADIQLHDHLTDNADWTAEFWDFDSKHLQTYAAQLERIFSGSIGGFEFQALWVEDKPTQTLELTIQEFLDAIRNSKIGTKTKYVVRKNA